MILKTEWYFLKDTYIVTHWPAYFGKENSKKKKKVILEKGWEEVPTLECLFVHKKLVLFLSAFVDDVKNGWKETKHGLCGKLDKKKSTLKIQRR